MMVKLGRRYGAEMTREGLRVAKWVMLYASNDGGLISHWKNTLCYTGYLGRDLPWQTVDIRGCRSNCWRVDWTPNQMSLVLFETYCWCFTEVLPLPSTIQKIIMFGISCLSSLWDFSGCNDWPTTHRSSPVKMPKRCLAECRGRWDWYRNLVKNITSRGDKWTSKGWV